MWRDRFPRSYTMLCYVITQILGTDGDADGKQSPGVIAPPLGGWEGLKLHGGLTVGLSEREMEGPPGTGMPNERKATGSWP